MRRPSVSRVREIRTHGLKGGSGTRARKSTAPDPYQCSAEPGVRRRPSFWAPSCSSCSEARWSRRSCSPASHGGSPLHQPRLGPRGDHGYLRSAGVSGAHLNPAVTVALAVHRGFAWRKVAPYVAAQVGGAFAGAAVTFLTYREAFDHFDGGARQVVGEKATAGIFATYPQPFLSTIGRLRGPGGGHGAAAPRDLRPGRPAETWPRAGGPLLVGALVVLIGMTFGFNAGYAINPARDFGPRLFTAMAGWGGEVFQAGALVVGAHRGPARGRVLGGFVYDLVITRHHPPERA